MSAHHGQGGADQAKGAGEVGLKVTGQLFIGRFLKRGKKPISGIVDEDIKRAELLDGFLDGSFRIGRLGQIKADCVGLSRMGRYEIGDVFRGAHG